MRRRWDGWEWGGFLFTVLAGTGLHFLYGWTGERSWIAGFSAVNESVWEHMKILYVPLFLLSMVQLCFQGRTSSNYLAARAAAVLCGTALIPVLYYTYTGALGRGFLAADIGIFLLSAAAVFLLDRVLRRRGALGDGWQQILGLLLLWGVMFLFVYLSFRPGHIPLFRDPVTGGYGIPK